MKNEWRKIVDIHPVRLYEDDISKLISLMTSCENQETCMINISLTDNEKEIQVNSFKELIENASNITTDKLVIDSIWSKENTRISGIYLTMYHNYIHYQIFSLHESWYLGKMEQLNRFFSKRKPWYSKIFGIKYFFPLLVVFGILSCIKFYNLDKGIFFFFSLIFTLVFLILSIIDSKSNLFPYVKIIVSKKSKKQFPYQLIALILGLCSLIVSIIGLLTK